MPLVRPFRPITYALDRFGSSSVPARVRMPGEAPDHPGRIADLTDLVCPPYDVIGPELQAELLQRDAHNAIRLELSAEPDPHASAARELAAWLGHRVLERRPNPSIYYYRHAQPSSPDDPAVQGVLARVLLEPFGDDVRAHEHTMPGPKADRLALLRATATQLSPILALYFDPTGRYADLMSLPWTNEWRARDGDGLLHALAEVEPDARLTAYLSRQRLFIADGHHRYETALAHQAEVRADAALGARPAGELAADWAMVVLVNAKAEPVEIHATHRIVVDAERGALTALAAGPDPLFQGIPSATEDLPGRMAELADVPAPIFGLAFQDQGWLLVGDPDAVQARMRREPLSSVVAGLDLSVLQTVILEDRLGISPEGAGSRVLYTKDPNDALSRVASGEVAAAILVRPTRLDQLARVANAGDVMPEKSTYFYPKLLTGLAFHPMHEDEPS